MTGFLPPSGLHDPSCEYLCRDPRSTCLHYCRPCDSKRSREDLVRASMGGMKLYRVGGTEVSFVFREHAERYVTALASQHRGDGPVPSALDIVEGELLAFDADPATACGHAYAAEVAARSAAKTDPMPMTSRTRTRRDTLADE